MPASAPRSTNAVICRARSSKSWSVRTSRWFISKEYLAEFVDWSGVAFFALGKLLVNAKPVEVPAICDGVFAIVDSATKTGSENDGTGVVYFAVNQHGYGVPLTVLDWDEHAQAMAAHESPYTTKLYDRTKERLTQDEVERIRL
jgi:hypothetical protein